MVQLPIVDNTAVHNGTTQWFSVTIVIRYQALYDFVYKAKENFSLSLFLFLSAQFRVLGYIQASLSVVLLQFRSHY